MKKKLIVALSLCVVFLLVLTGIKFFTKEKSNKDPLEEAAKRVELALGDEYKKQMKTELAGTLKYADQEGNEIKYHIIKTTYYEADPSEVTGLHTDALSILFEPDGANKCEEMMIKEWHAARYEFDGVSFLCWTDSPEVSYALEYNPAKIPDSEILKMAESAEKRAE